MPHTTDPITSASTLAELAATRAGASRVFQRHALDFCCHGRISLAEVCGNKHLALDALIAELELETAKSVDFTRWDERPLADLIAHLLERFHAPHRAELPRLLAMARKVERVHSDKPSCPTGLAAELERIGEELEAHMEKEEQVLFPLILSGRGRFASMAIQVMEEEHVDHGRNLERLREMTHGYTPPAEACGTWRALYLGLAELELALMQHIHLENNVLFPRALRS